jgi:hypothetical protein
MDNAVNQTQAKTAMVSASTRLNRLQVSPERAERLDRDSMRHTTRLRRPGRSYQSKDRINARTNAGAVRSRNRDNTGTRHRPPGARAAKYEARARAQFTA